MIYCNLKGGLGNMLFQIAATKSLSIDNGVDCSFPNLQHHLNYLNNDMSYNPKLKYSFDYNIIFNNLKSINPKTNKTINFPFHYHNAQLPNEDIMINGFFQSEKYFLHNRKSILEFFNFNEIDKKVRDKYKSLLEGKLTSIHVRRGDYVTHPNHHPVQTIEYYNKSVEIIDNDNTIVVFSDDIEWCKKNFDIDNIIYIENEKDYIEMYLMSLCDNNIISNSSFSWWGAWLNTNENKTVIAPNKWFGSAINENTDDIIPKGWIKI